MSPEFPRTLAWRYVSALLSVGIALLARLLLDPLVGNQMPFLTFCVAVVVVASYGGFGPSFLTILLGLLAAVYFFIPPRYALLVSLPEHQVQATSFLLLGLTIAVFSGALQAARGRAEAHTRELEREVTERKRLEQELQRRAEQLAEGD